MRNFPARIGLSYLAIFVIALLASCTPAGAGQDKSFLASYKFTDKNGLVILSARIGDGEPLLFLLDTGASPCVIDGATARQHGITVGASTKRQGGGGTFTSGVTTEPVRLTIGANVLVCSETIVTDLSGTTEVTGAKLGGIIGGDFFRGRVVAIDYDRDTVTVHDRALYRRRGSGEVLPIRVVKNRPYLTARLSVPGGPQRVPRELLIDTGSLDQIDDPLLERSNASMKTVETSGLGPGFKTKAGRFSKVEIGSLVFKDVPGVVPAVPLVGAGLIARFNPVFDYDGGWLALEKRQ